MTYIQDLSKLELDAYNLPELAGLAARILPLLGSDQAWTVLEGAANRVMQDNAGVVYAVRRHPDNRNRIDELAMYPKATTYDGWKAETLPLMVAASFLMGSTLADSAKTIQLGPMSTIEHFGTQAKAHLMNIGRGPGPDSDGFPPLNPIAYPHR